jgi:hypothetical protein
MHNALDSTRMYLKTDPTEKRSFVKRLKQLRNFAFDITVFIAKQPVHMVVKPIAFAANIVKAGLMGAGMLVNEARGEDSNICNSKQFKANAKQALGNLGESLVAWGTAALVVSGFGAPIAVSLFGANMSISLGAAKFGAAQPVASALNAGLGKAVAAIGTETGAAVMNTQGGLDFASRVWHYKALNPEELFHKEDGLNSLGEKVQKLHQEASNPEVDIEVRRQAQKEVDKIMKLQKIDKMAAPVLKNVTSAFRNRGH